MTDRTQARSAAAANVANNRSNYNNWDNYHYDDDDDWGYALAGAAVGATAGFIAGAAVSNSTTTVVTTPTYVTTLPCSPTVVAVNEMSYYQCGSTWYNRSYISGNVTYVTAAPPPGY